MYISQIIYSKKRYQIKVSAIYESQVAILVPKTAKLRIQPPQNINLDDWEIIPGFTPSNLEDYWIYPFDPEKKFICGSQWLFDEAEEYFKPLFDYYKEIVIEDL